MRFSIPKMLQREALRYNVYFCDAREIGPGHRASPRKKKCENKKK
jgi:hypothetical protein